VGVAASAIAVAWDSILLASASTTIVPEVLPANRVTVAMPWALVTAVAELREASVPGWETMVNTHTSPATGFPTVSSTVHVTVTELPVAGVGSLRLVVTLPTGGGYWADAVPPAMVRTIRATRSPMAAKAIAGRIFRRSSLIV
jgi:hypothetical protein